jgi:hypothetical protein
MTASASSAALLALLAMSGVRAADPVGISGTWKIVGAIKELRATDGNAPPLTPAATLVYKSNRAKWQAGDLSFDPTARCVSAGMPRSLTLPYPFKIYQNATQVFFLFEWNHWYRNVRITDKEREIPYPLSMGVASGQWSGDTLVITSVGLRSDNTLLDSSGLPHGERLHLTERMRLVGRDILQDRISIDDPETFTRTWDTVLTFTRQPADTEIREDVCLDRTDAKQPAIDWKKAQRQ